MKSGQNRAESEIQKNAHVKVLIPCLGEAKSCDLNVGFTVNDILQEACKGQPLIRAQETQLSVMDHHGWHVWVSKFCTTRHDRNNVDLSDINANSILSVCRFTDCVRSRHLMSSLWKMLKQNSTVKERFQKLTKTYCGFRSIKGDGNCYYRAVYFSLFEQIITTKKYSAFRTLYDLFSTVSFADDSDHFSEFMQTLKLASERRAWTTIEEFEADVLHVPDGSKVNLNMNLDLTIIKACRQIVAQYILVNQDKKLSELTIKESILPLYENAKSIEDYCDKYVLTMGIDAEGPFVNLGVLLLALNCKCTIILFDSRENVGLHTVECGSTVVSVTGHLHLLLREVHYDILYPLNGTYEPTQLSVSAPIVSTIHQNHSSPNRPNNNSGILKGGQQNVSFGVGSGGGGEKNQKSARFDHAEGEYPPKQGDSSHVRFAEELDDRQRSLHRHHTPISAHGGHHRDSDDDLEAPIRSALHSEMDGRHPSTPNGFTSPFKHSRDKIVKQTPESEVSLDNDVEGEDSIWHVVTPIREADASPASSIKSTRTPLSALSSTSALTTPLSTIQQDVKRLLLQMDVGMTIDVATEFAIKHSSVDEALAAFYGGTSSPLNMHGNSTSTPKVSPHTPATGRSPYAAIPAVSQSGHDHSPHAMRTELDTGMSPNTRPSRQPPSRFSKPPLTPGSAKMSPLNKQDDDVTSRHVDRHYPDSNNRHTPSKSRYHDSDRSDEEETEEEDENASLPLQALGERHGSKFYTAPSTLSPHTGNAVSDGHDSTPKAASNADGHDRWNAVGTKDHEAASHHRDEIEVSHKKAPAVTVTLTDKDNSMLKLNRGSRLMPQQAAVEGRGVTVNEDEDSDEHVDRGVDISAMDIDQYRQPLLKGLLGNNTGDLERSSSDKAEKKGYELTYESGGSRYPTQSFRYNKNMVKEQDKKPAVRPVRMVPRPKPKDRMDNKVGNNRLADDRIENESDSSMGDDPTWHTSRPTTPITPMVAKTPPTRTPVMETTPLTRTQQHLFDKLLQQSASISVDEAMSLAKLFDNVDDALQYYTQKNYYAKKVQENSPKGSTHLNGADTTNSSHNRRRDAPKGNAAMQDILSSSPPRRRELKPSSSTSQINGYNKSPIAQRPVRGIQHSASTSNVSDSLNRRTHPDTGLKNRVPARGIQHAASSSCIPSHTVAPPFEASPHFALSGEFLPLIDLGFTEVQIREAIEVGQCADLQSALAFLQRKTALMLSLGRKVAREQEAATMGPPPTGGPARKGGVAGVTGYGDDDISSLSGTDTGPGRSKKPALTAAQHRIYTRIRHMGTNMGTQMTNKEAAQMARKYKSMAEFDAYLLSTSGNVESVPVTQSGVTGMQQQNKTYIITADGEKKLLMAAQQNLTADQKRIVRILMDMTTDMTEVEAKHLALKFESMENFDIFIGTLNNGKGVNGLKTSASARSENKRGLMSFWNSSKSNDGMMDDDVFTDGDSEQAAEERRFKMHQQRRSTVWGKYFSCFAPTGVNNSTGFDGFDPSRRSEKGGGFWGSAGSVSSYGSTRSSRSNNRYDAYNARSNVMPIIPSDARRSSARR